MSKWKKFRYRLEYIGLLLGAWIIQRIPWCCLHPLGRTLGVFFFRVDRHRREVTLANLKAAFGDEYTLQERWKIGQQSSCHRHARRRPAF